MPNMHTITTVMQVRNEAMALFKEILNEQVPKVLYKHIKVVQTHLYIRSPRSRRMYVAGILQGPLSARDIVSCC